MSETDLEIKMMLHELPNYIPPDLFNTDFSKDISHVIPNYEKWFYQLKQLIVDEWGYDDEKLCNQDDSFIHCCVFILDKYENVVGGAIVHDSDMWWAGKKWLFISFFVIKEEFRCKGLGRKVIDILKEETLFEKENSIKNNPNGVSLALYAENWNSRSRSFYEKNDFLFLREEADVYDEHDGIARIYIWPDIDEVDAAW